MLKLSVAQELLLELAVDVLPFRVKVLASTYGNFHYCHFSVGAILRLVCVV